MGLTPTYGFHYPSGSDSPNGPAQIQQLAEDVEAQFLAALTSRDAAIALVKPKPKIAYCSADQNATTSDVDIAGCSISLTTTAPNTLLLCMAALDVGTTGPTDFPFVKLSVDGAVQSQNVKFQGVYRQGVVGVWVVNVPAPKTLTAKLILTKISNANVCTVYGTHSNIMVLGNGVS